ncbi:DUF4097 family beta strand repeat-containing protein [Streptacidiphilus monticola]|uniref:DUF4097 family beta strand repeat-containing protein n=1 Tax=Streptacidiphilus monticola TaxID=2161674 RepID=A0ABW1G1I4_9ACTN
MTEASRAYGAPRRRQRLFLALGAAVVAAAVVCGGVALDESDAGGTVHPEGQAVGGAGRLSLQGGSAEALELQLASANVTLSGSPGDELSGSFRPAEGSPVAHVQLRGGDGSVSLVCADAEGTTVACQGDLALEVPARTAVRLRLVSGQAQLQSLSGALNIDASSARIVATDLRTDDVALSAMSGSADLSFSAAPRSLRVTEQSASVALRVPTTPDGYAVTTQQASASVAVQVAQNAASSHVVRLQVASGSLALAPDAAAGPSVD